MYASLRPFGRVAALALCSILAMPVAAEVSGPYLAARSADRAAEFTLASMYYTQALVADPSNPGLMEGLVYNQMLGGNIESALPVARRLLSVQSSSQAANMALMAEQLRKGEFEPVLTDLAAGERVGPLVDGLIRGWAELGAGRSSQALDVFDDMAAQEGLAYFALYNKAMALAMVGDLEAADAIFSDPTLGLQFSRRGALAKMQVLSMLDRPAEALAVMDEVFPGTEDGELMALRGLLAAGAPVPFDVVRTPLEGAAEVYLLMASALRGEAPDVHALLHSRVAQYLRPDLADAALLSASALEGLEQYDLALAAYALVPETSVFSFTARSSAAQALYALGRKDDAVAEAKGLIKTYPNLVAAHLGLADLLRQNEDWLAAADAYSSAIDLIETPQARHWGIFYSRAITYERAKLWEKAEPDFRRALELNPDQPQVLNYLGYSMLEMKINLTEALDMIERAVAQRPEDGHIIDSLAWGLYLLGRYDEALPHMERASLLMPLDAIVTDHLGDVYWAVGRQLEARFQWRRALSFNPEEKDAVRIRRKLDIGLDAVLAEEGAPALDARAP